MSILTGINAKSFFLGAGLSLALGLLVQKTITCGKNDSPNSKKHDLNSRYFATDTEQETKADRNVNSRKDSKPAIFDAPDLDLRLIRKAEAVIRQRSSSVTVVVERCTNDHNYSAILRTAEALGIQNVWIIDPPAMTDGIGNVDIETENNYSNRQPNVPGLRLSPEEIEQRRLHHLFAQKATEWITVRDFETTAECLDALRETGHRVWVTDLSQKAVPLEPSHLEETGNWPLPKKLAIVMGTEAVGCSQEMLEAADLRIYLPLRGFADSLNLSVATALVIHHVFLLEPSYVGSMTEKERLTLRKAWFPKLARQRLLTKTEKRRRQKLLSTIAQCMQIQGKKDAGLHLFDTQIEKLAKLPETRKYLEELETSTQYNAHVVHKAVEDLVASPPEPLSDLRRADLHRVTFVGKNTKKFHKEHWKDMAATNRSKTPHLTTSSYFRERVVASSGAE